MGYGRTPETADRSFDRTEAFGRNNGFSHHGAAGVTDIDPQTAHKAVDFLGYFEKCRRTETR